MAEPMTEPMTGDPIESQIRLLLEVADPQMRAFLDLIAFVALTPRQALSLRREDVVLEAPSHMNLRLGYTGQEREASQIPLDPDLVSILQTYLDSTRQYDNSAPLFPYKRGRSARDLQGGTPSPQVPGKPLTTRRFQRMFEKLVGELGLPPLKLRDLRAFALRRRIMRGESPDTIAEQLGLRSAQFLVTALLPGRPGASAHVAPSAKAQARPVQRRRGRPREKEQRDAELAQMIGDHPDWTYGDAAREYGERHGLTTPLKAEAISKAVRRYEKRTGRR